jgi:hypothetical protein
MSLQHDIIFDDVSSLLFLQQAPVVNWLDVFVSERDRLRQILEDTSNGWCLSKGDHKCANHLVDPFTLVEQFFDRYEREIAEANDVTLSAGERDMIDSGRSLLCRRAALPPMQG